LSRPYSHKQIVFNAKDETETVALDLEFGLCSKLIVECVYAGFTGTLDFKGSVNPDITKVDLPHVLMASATIQSQSVTQLSETTETSTKHYLLPEVLPSMDVVMTRSAGTISMQVYGVAADRPIYS